MSIFRCTLTLLLAVGTLVGFPNALPAAEPQRLPVESFDVRIEGGSPPIAEVTFALALSEVSDYPVRITAVGSSVEEQLYFGTLQEGIYRLRAPLTKVGPGPLKVVLRTRVTNRITPTRVKGPTGEQEGTDDSLLSPRAAESYIRYLTWEGTVPR